MAKIIDDETGEQIICPCGSEDLGIVSFIFGSQVVCNSCGQTVV